MFQTILCPRSPAPRQPDCFRDLNLDTLIQPILEAEKSAELASFFYEPPDSPEEVIFRQDIQRDLLRGDNLRLFDDFSREIADLARLEARAEEDLHSGDRWRCHYLLCGHILDYGERYIRCVRDFCRNLPSLESRGLRQAAGALQALCSSPDFEALARRQADLRGQFDRAHYCMLIRYQTVRVKKYEGETDLSRNILSVFGKFRREDGKDYRQELREAPYADHVEAALLQCLSRVYPELFGALRAYVEEFSSFVDRGLLNFCRELRFYIGWLQATRSLREQGLPFCFPEFGEGRQFCTDCYDLALAGKLGAGVVRNDFSLEPGERIIVVTGPNQGGKTTFARALGQLHYLASLGLAVPGSAARLTLTDRVLTHFEREETRQGGRLRDDLVRLHERMETATDRSLLVINEIFASTTAADAVTLGRHMMQQLKDRGCLAVIVTFLAELAESGPEAVSMTGMTDPADPGRRTFRVIRRPPDGRTYAMTLADRHRLTYEQILRRIP